MQPQSLINHFSLPEQTIKKLSFCSSNKVSRVSEWASFLRPTQFEQTSALLYKALPEVNQLKVTSQARYEMLEILRPFVQGTIIGLTKNFLQQPLALPPEAQKCALLAQALQKHMIDGYTLVIRDALENKKKVGEEAFFVTAIHRAMTGIGLLFVRSYQIYTQPPRGLWHRLHSLFRLGDHFDLLETRIVDEVHSKTKVTSLENAYLRIILLASARPHQLSQNDVRAIYDAFGVWADYVKFDIELSSDNESFYYVNLDRDAGPLYKSRVDTDEAENLLIELKLKPLLSQLTKQSRESVEEISATALKIPKDISQNVIRHLLDAWGNVAQRRQDRTQTQMTAELCVGLSDCHYFVSNKVDFESFVRDAGNDSELRNSVSGGFTPAEAFGSNSEPATSERPVSRVEVQNVSQGGYCLLWKSDTPVRVQSGDVVGIKEFGKRMWTIGVVRWIRQKKQSSQLGVQILSDKTQPYAIAQAYDMGGYSDFMRALFVPASPFADTPASLITPSAPFHEMDRIKLLDGDSTFTGKLAEQLFATGSIQQFSFRKTDSDNQSQKKSSSSKW